MPRTRFPFGCLRTASQLGIKFYRLTSLPLSAQQADSGSLAGNPRRAARSSGLKQELGLCAGFQNHSGSDNIGAPVWDIYS